MDCPVPEYDGILTFELKFLKCENIITYDSGFFIDIGRTRNARQQECLMTPSDLLLENGTITFKQTKLHFLKGQSGWISH